MKKISRESQAGAMNGEDMVAGGTSLLFVSTGMIQKAHKKKGLKLIIRF